MCVHWTPTMSDALKRKLEELFQDKPDNELDQLYKKLKEYGVHNPDELSLLKEAHLKEAGLRTMEVLVLNTYNTGKFLFHFTN